MIFIETKNTIKTIVRLPEDLVEEIDRTLDDANCKYRSDFIRKSVYFYLSYINSNDKANGYLSEVMQQYLDARFKIFEESYKKLLFKGIVELEVLSQVISYYYNLDSEIVEELRKEVIYRIKEHN